MFIGTLIWPIFMAFLLSSKIKNPLIGKSMEFKSGETQETEKENIFESNSFFSQHNRLVGDNYPPSIGTVANF